MEHWYGQVLLMSLIWFFIHYVIAVALSAPLIYFGRKRAKWELWEFAVFVVPFLVLMLLMVFGGRYKGYRNFLTEPKYLGIVIPFAVLVRIVAGNVKKKRVWSLTLILLVCGAAVSIYFFTPPQELK
jgi:hypothetical protein